MVTVALGSSLATVLLSKQVALIEGVCAFALLAALQFAVSWASMRSGSIRAVIKSQPRLVFYKGQFQVAALRRERLTKGELRAAVRARGFASLDAIEAIVLETAGELSVIPKRDGAGRDALSDARGVPSDT